MIGTLRAATPGGSHLWPGRRGHVGQTIGIIEAMKIMNEITADRAGIVEGCWSATGSLLNMDHP